MQVIFMSVGRLIQLTVTVTTISLALLNLFSMLSMQDFGELYYCIVLFEILLKLYHVLLPDSNEEIVFFTVERFAQAKYGKSEATIIRFAMCIAITLISTMFFSYVSDVNM